MLYLGVYTYQCHCYVFMALSRLRQVLNGAFLCNLEVKLTSFNGNNGHSRFDLPSITTHFVDIQGGFIHQKAPSGYFPDLILTSMSWLCLVHIIMAWLCLVHIIMSWLCLVHIIMSWLCLVHIIMSWLCLVHIIMSWLCLVHIIMSWLCLVHIIMSWLCLVHIIMSWLFFTLTLGFTGERWQAGV